jgi:hypothetical protein
MKMKRLEKKLVLNKETVTNLESKSMDELRGGAVTSPPICRPTRDLNCETYYGTCATMVCPCI